MTDYSLKDTRRGNDMECFDCKYWKQLQDNGEDICLATENDDGLCDVIPPVGKTPEWCPMVKGCE